MQGKKRVVALVASGLVTLAAAGGGLRALAGQGEEAKVALPAEQVIASIRTAVAARPGRVLEVEAESEKGKTLCEVEVLADDGKTYEVGVDAATKKAVSVEVDDDKDDEADGD